MKITKKQLPYHCQHPNHSSPIMIYVPDNKKYTHICPVCKEETVIYGNIILP